MRPSHPARLDVPATERLRYRFDRERDLLLDRASENLRIALLYGGFGLFWIMAAVALAFAGFIFFGAVAGAVAAGNTIANFRNTREAIRLYREAQRWVL